MLDYQRLRTRESGYANAVAVPAEEIFVEEGHPKLPLKIAAEDALTNFRDPVPEDVVPLDVPFSSVAADSKTRRNEYITLERIMKYGATPGCKACAFSSEYSVHTPVCRARFNGLVRADRITSSAKSSQNL